MAGAKKGAKTRQNLLSERELRRILNACGNPQERLVIWGLAYSGMRISEFIHLRKDWIDFDDGLITIPPTQPCEKHYECRRNGGLWKPKTPDSARSFPLLPELKPILEEYFADHTEIAELIPNRTQAWRIVKRVTNRAGIKKRIFPHVFRGTLASILAGKDFDTLAIQSFMGWRSVHTADQYVRISPDRLKSLVARKW